MLGRFVCAVVVVLLSACGAGTPPNPSEALTAVAPPTAIATPPPASATPTATATASVGPTASPTTPLSERSLTFKSERYGYSIKYPVALYASQADLDGWDEISDGDGNDAFVDRDDLLIRMRTRQRPAGISLSAIVESNIAFFKSHFDATLKKRAKVSIGRYSGRWLTYTGERGGGKVLIQSVVVVTKTKMFHFYMFSLVGNEAIDRKLFRQIFETFTPPK